MAYSQPLTDPPGKAATAAAPASIPYRVGAGMADRGRRLADQFAFSRHCRLRSGRKPGIHGFISFIFLCFGFIGFGVLAYFQIWWQDR